MTLKQYQLEKGYGNTIKHWKESKRQIERKRDGETERGIGRGIRALLVENQENIYTMTKYFEEYTITARKIATSFT